MSANTRAAVGRQAAPRVRADARAGHGTVPVQRDTGGSSVGRVAFGFPGDRKCRRRIARAHDRFCAAQTPKIEPTVELGRLLHEAKRRVGHGRWVAWVEENCDFSIREAQRYMRVARHHAAVPTAEDRDVSFLSLRRAVRSLAVPRSTAGGMGEAHSGSAGQAPERRAAS